MVRLARRALAGIRALVHSARVEEDLDEELQAYLDAAVERHRQAGLSPDEAVRAARIELGSRTAVKQHVREAGWESRLDDLWHDARYALRTLRKSPGFTTVAVLTLALAIGANTAIFSIVNGLILRALPVAAPEQLALVSTEGATAAGYPAGWNFAMWEQIRQHGASLGQAVAWSVFSERLDLATVGEADPVDGLFVSGNFFQELGVVPVLGRAFAAVEDGLGRPESRVAIVSYGLWQRRFGGAVDIIGRPLLLNRVPVTIVGVAPPAFLGPEVGRAFDIALPIGSAPLILNDDAWGGPTGRSYLAVVLRLTPGRSLEAATTKLRGLQRQIIEEAMPPKGIWGENHDAMLKDALLLVPASAGISELRRQYSRAAITILVIAALVLLIACANIANLTMARGAARHRELSVRVALGAPRRRLIQQLFVESVALSAMGAVGGLLLAVWASDMLVTHMSTWFERVALDVSLDSRVVVFTIAVSLATAVLFGTAPALRASLVSPLDAMRDAVGADRRRSRIFPMRSGLVVTQVALSLVLVIAAGLFIRTFERLVALPLGFESDRTLIVDVNASRTDAGSGSRIGLYQRLALEVSTLPGVTHAAASLNTPANRGALLVTKYVVPGMPDPQPADRDAIVNFVTPGWFEAYRIPILNGRPIDRRDTTGAAQVGVVNEAFARRFFPGRDALGATIVDALVDAPPEYRLPKTIVGVVGDAIDQNLRYGPYPTLYLPLAQWNAVMPEPPQISVSVRVGAGSPASVARAVAATMTGIDRRLSFSFRLLEEQIDAGRHRERLVAWMAAFFGGLALLLAAIGLFGISSSAVVQRRTEIGIRIALGAQRRDVVRLALRQTLLATAAGLAIGLAAAAALTRYLQAMLFGITPLDLVTFVAAPAVLAMVAIVACFLPARRATTIDPMVALRCE
jgi:predicted permease